MSNSFLSMLDIRRLLAIYRSSAFGVFFLMKRKRIVVMGFMGSMPRWNALSSTRWPQPRKLSRPRFLFGFLCSFRTRIQKLAFGNRHRLEDKPIHPNMRFSSWERGRSDCSRECSL